MEWFLAAVAGLGLCLSVFNFLHARKRDRRALKVQLDTVMLTYPSGQLGAPFARVRATNIGHRPVKVTSMYMKLPDGKGLFITQPTILPGIEDTLLPITLADGESCCIHYSYAEVGEALLERTQSRKVSVTPMAEDSSGASHKGRPWSVDPEDLVGMPKP